MFYSCKVSRISPNESNYSWDVLALDGDDILSGKVIWVLWIEKMVNSISIYMYIFCCYYQVCSSPVDPPQIKYGYHTQQVDQLITWNWLDVSSPTLKYSDKVLCIFSTFSLLWHQIILIECNEDSVSLVPQVRSLLSFHKFSLLKIPVSDLSEELPKGNIALPYIYHFSITLHLPDIWLAGFKLCIISCIDFAWW